MLLRPTLPSLTGAARMPVSITQEVLRNGHLQPIKKSTLHATLSPTAFRQTAFYSLARIAPGARSPSQGLRIRYAVSVLCSLHPRSLRERITSELIRAFLNTARIPFSVVFGGISVFVCCFAASAIGALFFRYASICQRWLSRFRKFHRYL